MNKPPEAEHSGLDRTSLLAEIVAAGLHSLAQPLTAVQWNLEILALDGGSGPHERENTAALHAAEHAVAKLDFLREILRPFRARTEFVVESLSAAVAGAREEQKEILEREGLLVLLRGGSAAPVRAPREFLRRIGYLLIELIRWLQPATAKVEIAEEGDQVHLGVTLEFAGSLGSPRTPGEELVPLRSYIMVLGGSFEISPDSTSIRVVLPLATQPTQSPCETL